jgi:hypothetical protein
MAHYYGTLQGHRGEASRLGTKNAGLRTYAASWQGAVEVQLYHRDGKDYACVQLVPHRGSGVHATLYDGPVGELPVKE